MVDLQVDALSRFLCVILSPQWTQGGSTSHSQGWDVAFFLGAMKSEFHASSITQTSVRTTVHHTRTPESAISALEDALHVLPITSHIFPSILARHHLREPQEKTKAGGDS